MSGVVYKAEDMRAEFNARLTEHITSEDYQRLSREELRQLEPQYPNGVPADVLERAVTDRMMREYGDVLKPPTTE